MNDLKEIWLKFEDKLRGFIFARIRDKNITEDLLQEVFIRIHSNIDHLKDQTKLQSWIYQICRNLVIDYFRTDKKAVGQEYSQVIEEEEPDGSRVMEEALADMIKMMNGLPAEYCEALCLTELEGLSQKEYADKIGISYSGAKSRVQRSRRMLRDMLMNCCHYEFDKYGTILEISPKHCCCCCPN